MTAGGFHRYLIGSRTLPLLTKMLSISIYMSDVTNPMFLSVKLELLHLPGKMKATVTDFLDFFGKSPILELWGRGS